MATLKEISAQVNSIHGLVSFMIQYINQVSDPQYVEVDPTFEEAKDTFNKMRALLLLKINELPEF